MILLTFKFYTYILPSIWKNILSVFFSCLEIYLYLARIPGRGNLWPDKHANKMWSRWAIFLHPCSLLNLEELCLLSWTVHFNYKKGWSKVNGSVLQRTHSCPYILFNSVWGRSPESFPSYWNLGKEQVHLLAFAICSLSHLYVKSTVSCIIDIQ